MRLKNKGFTIIELLAVITIIGILSAFAFASYAKAQAKTRDTQRKSDLQDIKKASVLFYQDKSAYPCFSSPITACTGNSTTFGWAPPTHAQIQAYLVPTYLSKVAIDPLGNDSCATATPPPYLFSSGPNAGVFTIYAMLENSNDPDAKSAKPTPKGIPTSSSSSDGNITFTIGSGSCGGVRYNYWVNNP